MPPLHDILRSAQTIAVVGLSPNPDRISHQVARYLQDAGYRIIPVNPGPPDVLGEPSYRKVEELPDDLHIDIVDIFRSPQYTADIVRSVAARASRTGNQPVVWTQVGVSSEEAAQVAKAAGLRYVSNACTMAEHRMMR